MSKITPKNIAIIGCGYWGRNLVRNFAELGVLHTICDSDPEALNRVRVLCPDSAKETRFESVLANKEIQGVVMSTPASLHYTMTKKALEAGKDVFVEKPLALTAKEGEELVKLAEAKSRILMVGHLLEYHPAVVKLKELIDSGELGRIDYIYSSRLNLGRFRTEENILWSFAPHDIAVILLLLGEMPTAVSTHGGCYLNQGIADVTVTNLSFPSGARAHIFVSWLHPYKEQKLVVIGDQKMAVFDDVIPENKLALYEHRVRWVGRLPTSERNGAKPVEFTMVEPLKLECQHFLDCLSSRRRPKTDGSSGLRVLKVLEASQRSLEEPENTMPPAADRDYFVHSSSLIEEPASIGQGTKIWHFCHLMPHTNIGKNCTVGQNVFIAGKVTIGNNVKIENNVSIFDGVTLEDDVFCGPSCVFTNVKAPRSHLSQRGNYLPTMIKKGASIGANATIICGHTIGEHAFIGAGSVVTRDIPDYALAYGNPARIKGWVCQCGTKLDFGQDSQAKCSRCGKKYIRLKTEGELKVERTRL